MSARVRTDPNLARYEGLASGAIPARNAEELKTALALGRTKWQTTVTESRAQVQLAQAEELERRKLALQQRARERLMPSDKQLMAQAKLQHQLAAVGAQAAESYIAVQTPSHDNSFRARVHMAMATGESGEPVVEPDAAPDAPNKAEGDSAPPATKPTNTIAGLSNLVEFGVAEQQAILEAGKMATECLREATSACTDEMSFVIQQVGVSYP